MTKFVFPIVNAAASFWPATSGDACGGPLQRLPRWSSLSTWIDICRWLHLLLYSSVRNGNLRRAAEPKLTACPRVWCDEHEKPCGKETSSPVTEMTIFKPCTELRTSLQGDLQWVLISCWLGSLARDDWSNLSSSFFYAILMYAM